MEDTKSRFKRICVFCGSSSGKKPTYQEAAVQLGRELVTFFFFSTYLFRYNIRILHHRPVFFLKFIEFRFLFWPLLFKTWSSKRRIDIQNWWMIESESHGIFGFDISYIFVGLNELFLFLLPLFVPSAALLREPFCCSIINLFLL